MSSIINLVQSLYSTGVEYKQLKEIASYKDGKPHENILRDSGRYVVAKVRFISTNGEFRKYADIRLSPVEKNDVIMVMSDLPHGQSLAKCFIIEENELYSINQRVCALTIKNDRVLPKFLYYSLNRNKQLLAYDSGYNQTHLKKQWILDVKIPVPPLDIQSEVIRIFDSFSMLQKELLNELNARKQQYEYYQSKLFSFDGDVPTKSLLDCCALEKGQTPIMKADAGEYPLVITTPVRKTSDRYQFNSPTVCVPLVSSRGHGVASLNHVFYQEGKFALGNILCGITPNDNTVLLAEYLYYYLSFRKNTLLVPLMKGGANVSLTVNSLKGVVIPIPSYATQKKIVEILKPFDKFFNAIENEIEARKRQYDYYRDMLLTFKELGT